MLSVSFGVHPESDGTCTFENLFRDERESTETNPRKSRDVFTIPTRFVKKYTHVRRLQVEAKTPYGVVAHARLRDSTVTKSPVDKIWHR